MTGDELAQLEAAEGNAITFGTYMSGTPTTRAGRPGSIDTDALKTGTHKTDGFGVFAYYTGSANYNTKNGASATLAPNFMFNQQVTWNASAVAGSVTKWQYSPVKYWPNEVQNGAVDDQDNDASDNQATGSTTYGGNVSFFAYAPFVDFSTTTTTGINQTSPTAGSSEGNVGGIVAINGLTALADANTVNGDPKLTYKIATGGNTVDLLWGTRGDTGKNVIEGENAGVVSTAPSPVSTPVASRSTYAEDILKGYTTNADLTKQKTEGTVAFAFKHALAKVGGSTTTVPTGTASPNGLMVVLDIDDMKGAETGGTKDGTTLVTIKSITIAATAKTPDSEGKKPGDAGYTKTYFKNDGAVFNLATGKWDLSTVKTTTVGDATTINHTINPNGTGANATLNTTIAEPSSAPTYNTSEWLLTGVTTTKTNVYSEETNPFVFIPGTYPELTITVDYLVRTYDENLATPSGESATCSIVGQKITKKITFNNPVELNKQYNLLMHLGLTSVKFSASVSAWDVDGTDSNSDGVIDENEITVTDVHLPINVSNVVAAGTFAAGSTLNVAAEAGTSKATITV